MIIVNTGLLIRQVLPCIYVCKRIRLKELRRAVICCEKSQQSLYKNEKIFAKNNIN